MDVKHLIETYKKTFPDNAVYVWTGHSFDEALKRLEHHAQYVDYLITEPFVEELKGEYYLRRLKQSAYI